MLDNIYFQDSYYNDSYSSNNDEVESYYIECDTCGDYLKEGTKYLNLENQKICLECVKHYTEVL